MTSGEDLLAKLTNRQREVLNLLLERLSDREIKRLLELVSVMAARISVSDWFFEIKPRNPASRVARISARVSDAETMTKWVAGEASRAAFKESSCSKPDRSVPASTKSKPPLRSWDNASFKLLALITLARGSSVRRRLHNPMR